MYFLDTETTGINPTDRIVQIAYKAENADEIISAYFKPAVPISIESMEVTHITPQMVEDKPPFYQSDLWKKTKELFADEKNILVAHNAAFDMMMLANDDIPVATFIDTMKLAQCLDDDGVIPSVRLQYLRYFWNLDITLPDGIFPHDARADIIVCEQLYHKMKADLEKMTGKTGDDLIHEMIEMSKRPRTIKIFGFGKYKGEKVADVAKKDPAYLQWLYEQKKQNPATEGDWIYTIETCLKKKDTLF